MKNYRCLTPEEKGAITVLYNVQKLRATDIAIQLQRSKATISNELRRHRDDNKFYCAEKARINSETVKRSSQRKNRKQYEQFLIYLENNFNRLCFGVDVCVNMARSKGYQTPCTKTVYN